MYHWMDGWGWFWMSFMMVFRIVVLGAVVYAAVKLANRPPTDPEKPLVNAGMKGVCRECLDRVLFAARPRLPADDAPRPRPRRWP